MEKKLPQKLQFENCGINKTDPTCVSKVTEHTAWYTKKVIFY